MLRVMFVDDDTVIRQTIRQTIRWQELGYDLVCVAKDPLEAIDYVLYHPVDILLTDIAMPVMSGIDMVKEIHQIKPELLVIFLTGYEDFAYAKAAIQLKAMDYLTKPITAQSLLEVLGKAKEQVIRHSYEKQIIETSLPFLQRQYLAKTLATKYLDLNEAQKYGISLPCGNGITGSLVFGITQQTSQQDIIFFPHDFSDAMAKLLADVYILPNSYAKYTVVYLPNELSAEIDFSEHLQMLLQDAIQNLTSTPYTVKLNKPFFELSGVVDSLSAQCPKEPKVTLVQSICLYIQEHYMDTELSLRSIAQHFNINHCYMTTTFKKQMGTGVYDYLIRVRMEKAKELLLSTDYKVSDIAFLVGYLDSQYFSKSFHKQYGISVSTFRPKIDAKGRKSERNDSL